MQAPDIVTLIPGSLIGEVKAESALAEAHGQLTPRQLQILRDKGWLRLLIPRSIGGLEYNLPELLALQEAASWVDGSFGWVLALCGGAGFFAGFIEKSLAIELFGRVDVCAAGTGFPGGSAEAVEGGYRVSGHWRYASGAPHSTLYTANCVAGEAAGSEPPVIRAVIFLPSQVSLENGWQSLGLKATASQDMIVRDAFVPDARTFTLDVPFAHAQGPLYFYPFLRQAEAVLSVTLLGMTRHYLDLFSERVIPKFNGSAEVLLSGVLEEVKEDLERTRTKFYHTVNCSWKPFAQGYKGAGQVSGAGDDEILAWLEAVGEVAREATGTALRCADRLYPYGGMEMMQTATDINRVWRDIHTASQHILLAPLKREA